MRIIKHEWHQVDSRSAMEINRVDLDEIWPDLNTGAKDTIWQQILDNDYDFQELIEDAQSAGIWHLDWDHLDDDWWTHRKGGYDVTFEIEPDYVKPIDEHTDKQRIEMLESEVSQLRAELKAIRGDAK